MSAPPATTGVPGRRPVCSAAAAVTVPITVPGSCTGGSTLAGRPLRAAISSDQARSARLNIPELDPQDGSVASTPDSRVAIQSLSMPRPLVRARMSGRCRASQRSRAGVVIATQSPPSA